MIGLHFSKLVFEWVDSFLSNFIGTYVPELELASFASIGWITCLVFSTTAVEIGAWVEIITFCATSSPTSKFSKNPQKEQYGRPLLLYPLEHFH